MSVPGCSGGFRAACCGAGLLLLVLCSCATAGGIAPFKSAPLFGMVYQDDGTPAAGVEVFIDGHGGVYTDAGGRFVKEALAAGPHCVETRAEGFEPTTQRVEFRNRTEVIHVTLTALAALEERACREITTGGYARARSLVGRCLLVEPERPGALFLLAVIEIASGNRDEAVRLLTRVEDQGLVVPTVAQLEALSGNNDAQPGDSVRAEELK